MEFQYSYMVCTRCFTFNHHAYIEDAMNGFCIQETDFPFVCVIVDDASTDGEPEVIRKYFQANFGLLEKEETEDFVLNFGRHNVNENCYFVVLYLKYNHYSIKKDKFPYFAKWRDNSKYIALCEGDDYWIDEKKLQRQMEVLEKNENVQMVYANYQTVDENKNIIVRPQYEKLKKKSKSGDILPILFQTNFPLTVTTMWRKEVFSTQLYLSAPSRMDYMMVFSAAFIGDVYYFHEEMGAYRDSPNGMMNAIPNRVRESITSVKIHASYAYLNGQSKKENIWNDFIIKYRIMCQALGLLKEGVKQDFFCNIFKINKIMVLYVLPSATMLFVKKLIRIFNAHIPQRD